MALFKDKKIVKISILGPKPYSLGGHDASGELRSKIQKSISFILDGLEKEDKVVLGLTGLSLGLEQDFAQICKDKGISYNVYLSHDSVDAQWEHLPSNICEKYNELLENAHSSIVLDDGGYSPKKIVHRQLRILKDSDIVIYVSGFLPQKNERIKDSLVEKGSALITIDLMSI